MSRLSVEMSTDALAPYRNQTIALLTQHGKERVIAPALEPALGCRLRVVDGYDTDQLGTFTRDVSRTGSQLSAARRKAQLAIELSGLPYGLGSEGTFGPDPMVGSLSWNVEVLVFVDAERDLEVVGEAHGPGLHQHVWTSTWADVATLARRVGFPSQQLVMGNRLNGQPPLTKGLDSWAKLEAAFEDFHAQSTSGAVWVETDLRAHAHPTRMARIGEAATDLANRLQQHCPACGCPGFWPVERVAGLTCRDCGYPTRLTRAWVHGCQRCHHRETRIVASDRLAPPERCDMCNP